MLVAPSEINEQYLALRQCESSNVNKCELEYVYSFQMCELLPCYGGDRRAFSKCYYFAIPVFKVGDSECVSSSTEYHRSLVGSG